MEYMPCLRWMAGEKKALENLTLANEQLWPLFFVKDDIMLQKLASELNDYWPHDCLVDFSRIVINTSTLIPVH
jgi:hypothetical protein